MKFGKLDNVDQVDFTLPVDPEGTTRFLAQLSPIENPNIYFGCTGWSMKEWIGSVYPTGTKTKEYLHYYSRQFNTIEFNTTHYRIPDPDTVTRWKEESDKDFRFCPKIPQNISHRNDLSIGSGLITQFCDNISGLDEKLGCCFMQLPPYFGYDRIKILERFLESFPEIIPLAIEVRHQSWFEKVEHIEALAQLLEKYNRSTCITDVAGRRDVLHQRLTNTTAMIRFVGNGLHPTDYTRIDDWVIKIDEWLKAGINEIYFFAHEPDNVLSPKLCAYLSSQINEKTNYEVEVPNLEAKPRNNQISLF